MDRLSLPEPIRYLMDLPKFGRGIGLHRMLWLYDRILAGHPGTAFDAIKVTGSNGKGSVCAMLASILAALGARPGLYTSPHLVHFHERICLDGARISDDDLAETVRWYRAAEQEYRGLYPDDGLGAFEAFTAVALYHYARKEARTLVIEAGIGGRYDSTRIVPGPLVALTSLDLEHQELLGDSLELIAYDKLDLCPEGGTVVAGPLDADSLRRASAYCRLRNVELVPVETVARALTIRSADTRMFVEMEVEARRWPDVEVGLRGPHQATNALVSLVLARHWAAAHLPGLSTSDFEAAARRGLATARWAGRFEQIHTDPDVFIDVGHSPAAAEALVGTVRTCLAGRPLLLVTGVSYNKAVEPIITRLVPLADEVICTRAYHKGSEVATIEALVRRHRPDVPVSSAATIEEATAQALARASQTDMTVLVGGGLFLSIEFQQALRGDDPQALYFF
jgi:dihydrofolate synthase/folylpolyglutamate synthase